jgi:hypothetical protein
MWILTPTTRGAEQEVKSLTIHAALHRPITLSCEISIEAMRYTTTCHRLGRRPEPTEARQACPRDRPQAGRLTKLLFWAMTGDPGHQVVAPGGRQRPETDRGRASDGSVTVKRHYATTSG